MGDLHGADGEEHLVEPLVEEVVERLDVRPVQLPQRRVVLLLTRRRRRGGRLTGRHLHVRGRDTVRQGMARRGRAPTSGGGVGAFGGKGKTLERVA